MATEGPVWVLRWDKVAVGLGTGRVGQAFECWWRGGGGQGR